jgi:uncharacterized protein (DUF736 family)
VKGLIDCPNRNVRSLRLRRILLTSWRSGEAHRQIGERGGDAGDLFAQFQQSPRIVVVRRVGRHSILQAIHESRPDFRVLSEGIEIAAGWSRRSEASGRDYVSLSLAAPEFGPRRLYANLGRAEGEDEDSFALIWNSAD